MSDLVTIVWLLVGVMPPCLIVLFEKKAPKGAKAGGVLACLLFSWLGLAAYYLIRILKKHATSTASP